MDSCPILGLTFLSPNTPILPPPGNACVQGSGNVQWLTRQVGGLGPKKEAISSQNCPPTTCLGRGRKQMTLLRCEEAEGEGEGHGLRTSAPQGSLCPSSKGVCGTAEGLRPLSWGQHLGLRWASWAMRHWHMVVSLGGLPCDFGPPCFLPLTWQIRPLASARLGGGLQRLLLRRKRARERESAHPAFRPSVLGRLHPA